MAKEKQKVTYLFLASRKYPFPEDDFDYTYSDNNDPEIKAKKNQEIVALDVTTSFSNSWEGNLTSYPVSAGSEISDHITIRNNKYVLEGIVSDTPIEVHKNESIGQLGTGYNRTYAALDMIKEMYTNKVIFTLFSEYQRIDNCVITGVSFDQSADFSIRFKITMEQVRLAYAKTVSLNVKASTKKKTDSNKNGGGTTKNQADTDQYRRNREEAIKRNNAGG